MKVVLDTNVLISGFLNPYGAPGSLVQLAAEGILTLCYDARILAEYHEVLLRPRFGLRPDAIENFLNQIKVQGDLIVPRLLAKHLPDTDDEAFLEIAIAANVCLVTGNLKHFPPTHRGSVKVLLPAEFHEILQKPLR